MSCTLVFGRAFALSRARASAVALLLLPCWVACVSTPTQQRMNGVYDAASQRLREPPPRPSRELDAKLGAPLERDAVVALAVARSPSLATMAHRARALIHAGRAEGALPAAELGVEVWNLPLTRPYAVGEADMYMVEFRQRFPASGSLDARARAMTAEAEALLAELAAEERVTAQRAAEAFAAYAQALEERALQARQLALIQQMAQVVRARYSTGGSALVDAPRMELEVAKMQRALARSAGEIFRARATINGLLRRPVSAELGAPRAVPAETVRLTTAELVARSEQKRGQTLAVAARLRAAQARRDAADAEAKNPEFMAGLGYWQDPEMRAGVGATFATSLPWLWGPGSERAAQAREEEASEVAAWDVASIDVQSELNSAQVRLVALEEQLVVVHQRALPAARRSIEALAAAYAGGRASLLEWVDAARSVLDLEMEQAALRGELALAVAALELAVGARLPRVPLTLEEPR